MTIARSRGVCASFIVSLWCAVLTACQPSVPVRQIYLPADCPSKTSMSHHGVTEEPGLPQAVATPELPAPKTPTPKPAEVAARTAPAQPASPQPAPSPAAQTPSGLVDLNTATDAQLQTLPGIGPAMAKRIMERRQKRRFKRVRDLRRVRGVGPATYARLKELVQVSQAGLKPRVDSANHEK